MKSNEKVNRMTVADRVGAESETANQKIAGTSPKTVRVQSEKAAPESENMALRGRKHTADFRDMVRKTAVQICYK